MILDDRSAAERSFTPRFLRGGRQPMHVVTDEHGYLRYTVSPAIHPDPNPGWDLRDWLFDLFVLPRLDVEIVAAPTREAQLWETIYTGSPEPLSPELAVA